MKKIFFWAGIFLWLSLFVSGCEWLGSKKIKKQKLVIVGIDAGTWKIILPLLREGRLPNFQALMERGSSGYLATLKTTSASPVLWTSILTGKLPEKHGIKGYISVRGFPVNSTMRKVKDLAEILSDGGYTVGFVGFWASWPAQKVRGWLVSDLVSLGRFKDSQASANWYVDDYSYLLKIKKVTYPEDLLKELYPLLLSPHQIPREFYQRVCEFNDREWEEFQKIHWVSRTDFESLLKYSIVSDLNFQRIALYLLKEKKPEVLAVYFEGPDIIEHFFWRYMEPEYFSGVSEREKERFGETIRNYYQVIDDYIGELRASAEPGTAFLIISDHGMERVIKEGSEALHSGSHAQKHPDGIMIFSGPGIKAQRDKMVQGASLLDITPTILYYLGLPVAEDMDGEVLMELFTEEFLKSHPLKLIPTYEKKRKRIKEQASPLDSEMVKKLRALGYIH